MGLGIASRSIDTAEWRAAWIGLILSPWLAGPWLAGAWVARRDASLAWGAAAGFILLAATVATYLALARAPMPRDCFRACRCWRWRPGPATGRPARRSTTERGVDSLPLS